MMEKLCAKCDNFQTEQIEKNAISNKYSNNH